MIIGVIRLYYAGYVPKVFLVASAHAVPVSQIVARVAARRCDGLVCPCASNPLLDCTYLLTSLPKRPVFQDESPQTSTRPLIRPRHCASVTGRRGGDAQVSLGEGQTSTRRHTRARAASCNGHAEFNTYRHSAATDVVLASGGCCLIRNTMVAPALHQPARRRGRTASRRLTSVKSLKREIRSADTKQVILSIDRCRQVIRPIDRSTISCTVEDTTILGKALATAARREEADGHRKIDAAQDQFQRRWGCHASDGSAGARTEAH